MVHTIRGYMKEINKMNFNAGCRGRCLGRLTFYVYFSTEQLNFFCGDLIM